MKIDRALEIARAARPRVVEPMSARDLFGKDDSAFGRRDRQQYISFDAMPAGLQQWWADRAGWINRMNARRRISQ